jgi:hypothetical protein
MKTCRYKRRFNLCQYRKLVLTWQLELGEILLAYNHLTEWASLVRERRWCADYSPVTYLRCKAQGKHSWDNGCACFYMPSISCAVRLHWGCDVKERLTRFTLRRKLDETYMLTPRERCQMLRFAVKSNTHVCAMMLTMRLVVETLPNSKRNSTFAEPEWMGNSVRLGAADLSART